MSFRPTVRHLYLLALFQLVGGPLVILAVVVFSKLAVQHVPEQGIQQGFATVLQSAEWQDVLDTATLGGTQDTRKSSGPDKLPPPKPENVKFLAITWSDFSIPPTSLPPAEPPREALIGILSDWPHAPPNPPPRWV